MAKVRLDRNLLKKLTEKTSKSEKYMREQISKKADKLCINSEAALVILAKRAGIGTAVYQRRLSPYVQGQIRDSLPSLFSVKITNSQKVERKTPQQKPPLSLAIEYLIQDNELRDRCGDLIKAPRNFDRAFREATTVLEDRIKKLSRIKEQMKPVDLVGKALNPDPVKAILKISEEKSEQEGFFNICKGLILSFRDPTHHKLSDKFTRQDALKFCGLVDSLLGALTRTLNEN